MHITSDIYKVNCGSIVTHFMCYDCEGEWREKMPLQDGIQPMTCPICRQPERERSIESRKRENLRLRLQLQEKIGQDPVTIHSVHARLGSKGIVMNWIRPPFSLERHVCASGRECKEIRTKTRLKCRICNIVPCCRMCKTCA